MIARRLRIIFALTLITLVIGPFAGLPSAWAASVVGDGTSASCTEQALITALRIGGAVSFNCGPAPHTITLTSPQTITTNTEIDGADQITLSGGNTTRLFVINPGVTTTLRRLTITDGFNNGDGGAIRNNGTLTIIQSTFRDNATTNNGSGGAIVSYGPVTIIGSQFINNQAANGGALYPRWQAGTMLIRDSLLRDNKTLHPRDGWGGAILIWDGASAIIENSRVTGNSARSGGAIFNSGGVLSLSNGTVIADNTAEVAGGGIVNTDSTGPGQATIVDSSLRGNRVLNVESDGGAIFNQAMLLLRGATLDGNQAGRGGAISTYGSAEITSSTLSGNSAVEGGGILNHEGGETEVHFSTLFDNRATERGGNLHSEFGGLEVRGTIIAAGSCAGRPPLSHGYNLETADTCDLSEPTDLPQTDPRLLALDENAGFTTTHLPLPDSPVINAGGPECPATDQRGLGRPQGPACDIGAVEVLPGGATCGGTVDVAEDTTIDSANPEQAADGDPVLRVARTPEGETNALLRFDLAGRLPPGSQILSATLELPIVRATSTVSDVIEVEGLRESWQEGVNWNTRPASQATYGLSAAGLGIPLLRADLSTLAMHWSTGMVSETSVLLRPALPEMDLLLASRDGSGPGARLVIMCAATPTELPVDQSALNQDQLEGLRLLKDGSTTPPWLQIERGVIRYARFAVQVPAHVEQTSLAQAVWFLNTYRNLLRLDATLDELQLIRYSEDEQSLFFRQLHRGVPVYGAELVVHLDRMGKVDGLGGIYLPSITLDVRPTLEATEAEALATTATPGDDDVLGDTQLRYFNGRLLNQEEDRTTLAWQVNLRTSEGDVTFLVDAQTGAILFKESRHHEGYDLDLEDGNNELPRDLCGLFDDDDIDPNSSPEARRAATNARRTYDYWRNTFGRDSYDDDGEQIELNINVGGPPNAAYMGCDIFVFSNGFTVLDVVGHEFSHAVDENEARLIYQNQSGALDESFADIWGYFTENEDNDWLLGEDLPGGALRDMSNPPAFGDPDVMTNLLMTTNDNGGVHTNSGIHNKVAYLLTAAGRKTHNGFAVNSLGKRDAQRLFHNVFTGCLWSSAQFIDARNCAVTEAQKIPGVRVCEVRNAYASVGLGQGDRDCDGIEDNVDPDNDGDWIPNNRDNCQNLFNPAQNDLDGDGQGDECDTDIDGDGVLNLRPNGTSWDNCRYAANPGQEDADGDGEGDACDDRDGDGHLDVRDNCPDVQNNQSDIDGDGRGDACDPDIDNDGRLNAVDNCAFVANPGQENRDGDAYGDACDTCPDLNHPDNGDVDRDGLGNPCDPDADNDGICNRGGPLTDLPGLLPGGCVAGPRLLRPEGADNCLLEHNPSQIDRDNNGVGLACDRAEQEELGRQVKYYNDRFQFRDRSPIRVPLGFCPRCTTEYLPRLFETQIDLLLPSQVRARVVNSLGQTVAKTQMVGNVARLRFSPVPFTGRSFKTGTQGTLAASLRGEATGLVPSDTRYYLELVPAPDIDPTRTYAVRGTVTEDGGVTAVFLPLTRR